jgi:hypothetical protein
MGKARSFDEAWLLVALFVIAAWLVVAIGVGLGAIVGAIAGMFA